MLPEFGLNACFFHSVAHAQKDRRVACIASGETRRQSDFQIRLLVWLKRLPPMADWLAAFYSRCQNPSTHVYSCCHRTLYSSSHTTAELVKKKKKMHWLAATFEIHEWKRLIKNRVFHKKMETRSSSNVCKGDKWLWSALFFKNNGAATLSKFFSFRSPLIGSVEQQNCIQCS